MKRIEDMRAEKRSHRSSHHHHHHRLDHSTKKSCHPVNRIFNNSSPLNSPILTKFQNPLELIIKSSYTKLNLEIPADPNEIVLGMLRDRAYQLFGSNNQHIETECQKAKQIILYRPPNIFNDLAHVDQLSVEQIESGVLQRLMMDMRSMFQYVVKLPGFDDMEKSDVASLMKENFLLLHPVQFSRLLVNGEWFAILPGEIFYTRRCQEKWLGPDWAKVMLAFASGLNSLELTQYEMSLILPYILSSYSDYGKLKYGDKAKKIHEMYRDAMLREFRLNNRDYQFSVRLTQVCL